MKKYLAQVIKKLLIPFYFSLPIKVNGKKFWVPIQNGLGLGNIFLTDYEPWMHKLLKEILLFKKGAFIDVGANIGQTLLNFRSISKTNHYVGFEVNANCFKILQSIVNKNHLSNCTLLPLGLSNGFGLFQVWSVSEVGAFATIEKDIVYSNMKPQSHCVVQSLDVLAESHALSAVMESGISCIKIDVEGHEAQVLYGMQNVVTKHRPFIFIEVLNHVLTEKKILVKEWCALNRYTIFYPNIGATFTEINWIKINEFNSSKEFNPQESNYVLVPIEFESSFEAF